MMIVDGLFYMFYKLVLINETLKVQRYQHVLVSIAIVHQDNIKDTIFSIFVCVFMYIVFYTWIV